MAVIQLSDVRSRRQSVFYPGSKNRNNDVSLKDFQLHLVAVRGLGKPTAGMYCRALAVALGRIGSAAPSKTELMQYVAGMRDLYSYKYVVNTSRAIEEYTAWMGRPMSFKRPKKPKQAIGEVLTEAEVAVILVVGCSGIREKAMIATLAYSGIRNSEFCNLLVSDIDIANNLIRVRVGKNSKDRTTNIAGECVQILMQYLNEFPRSSDDYLFTTLRCGRQYEPPSLRKMVHKIAKKSEITKRTHPHIFRHSLAVNMMRRGASVWDIKDQLGHDDVMTTIQIYLRCYKPNSRANYMKFCPSYI